MSELSPFSRAIATATVTGHDLIVSETRYEARLLLVGDQQVLATVISSRLPPPPPANRASIAAEATLLWLSPRQWLVLTTTAVARDTCDALAVIRAGGSCFAYDVRARFAGLTIQGAHAAELLSTGCGLDFRDRQFPVGTSARTRLEQAPVILFRRATAEYEVLLERPLAHYLWRWAQEAAREWLQPELE